MVTIRFDMGDDHTDWKAAAKAVPELRFLKTLVTALTAVLGLGIIALVALLWIRLGQPTLPQLPDNIALPDGTTVQAVTFSADWTVVVTDRGEIMVFDRTGALKNRMQP